MPSVRYIHYIHCMTSNHIRSHCITLRTNKHTYILIQYHTTPYHTMPYNTPYNTYLTYVTVGGTANTCNHFLREGGSTSILNAVATRTSSQTSKLYVHRRAPLAMGVCSSMNHPNSTLSFGFDSHDLSQLPILAEDQHELCLHASFPMTLSGHLGKLGGPNAPCTERKCNVHVLGRVQAAEAMVLRDQSAPPRSIRSIFELLLVLGEALGLQEDPNNAALYWVGTVGDDQARVPQIWFISFGQFCGAMPLRSEMRAFSCNMRYAMVATCPSSTEIVLSSRASRTPDWMHDASKLLSSARDVRPSLARSLPCP